MPTYYCEICNFKTKIKQHLKTHHNTKKHKINEEKMHLKNQENSTKEHKIAQPIAQNSTKEHKTKGIYRCENCRKKCW